MSTPNSTPSPPTQSKHTWSSWKKKGLSNGRRMVGRYSYMMIGDGRRKNFQFFSSPITNHHVNQLAQAWSVPDRRCAERLSRGLRIIELVQAVQNGTDALQALFDLARLHFKHLNLLGQLRQLS